MRQLAIRSGAGLAAAAAVALSAAPAAADPVPGPGKDPRPPLVASAVPADGKPGPDPKFPAEQRRVGCNRSQAAGAGPTVPAPQRFLNTAQALMFARGRGQTVAVIDTGVSRHPRLPGLTGGGDYIMGGDGLSDCDVHGTVVAGIIGAAQQPGDGFAGVAPDARIVSIRQSSSMFQVKGQAEPPQGAKPNAYGYMSDLARAIRHAADTPGVTVINISEVACSPSKFTAPEMGAAVHYATVQRNVVVVAAAGNEDKGSACRSNTGLLDPAKPTDDPWTKISSYVTPAWLDDVLSVGSVTADGTPSEFTVAGPWVDVAAPGENIVSLDARGPGLASGSISEQGEPQPNKGTSFACPYVAGTVALVRERYPWLSAREVMARVKNTAHPPAEGWNPYVGNGIIDPVAALTADLLPGSVNPVNMPVSRQLPLPVPPPAPDHTARNIALGASGGVLGLLALGTLASFPARRRFSAPDPAEMMVGRRVFAEPPESPPVAKTPKKDGPPGPVTESSADG